MALLIYGANGYTGRLICEQAKKTGLDFVIAGRSEEKLRALAATLEVPYQSFDLVTASLDTYLQAPTVLLDCAGPFAQTARILVEACIRCKTHYLDVSAVLESYLFASEMSEAAKEAGLMLLPGCGGSIAMLGFLAAHAQRQVAKPLSIDIALHVAGSMSRGSAVSAAASATAGCLRLEDGKLVPRDTAHQAIFDYGDGRGPVSCFPVTLPDLITLQASTGSDTIQTFVNVSADAFPGGNPASRPDGPSLEERASSPYHAAIKMRESDGTSTRAVLRTVNGYTFTAVASVEAARRVLAGHVRAGWQTPATVFGASLIGAVPGTIIRESMKGKEKGS